MCQDLGLGLGPVCSRAVAATLSARSSLSPSCPRDQHAGAAWATPGRRCGSGAWGRGLRRVYGGKRGGCVPAAPPPFPCAAYMLAASLSSSLSQALATAVLHTMVAH